jgi:hypothetical protein
VNRPERGSDRVTVPVWHEGVETFGGVIVCPECRVPGVVVLSAAELVEHMTALGRVADVRAAYQRVPGASCWWCHACTCGGVMVLD